INTHHHFDHTAGNIAFKDITEVILAHENSKANQVTTAEERGNVNEQLFPDTVFKDNWSGRLGSETITAKYFGPAHTNGDGIIHFENDNVAHVGDLVFNRRFPYIDMKAGASIINWVEVLNKINNHYDNDTLFIFGHSSEGYPVTGSKNDLSAMGNYLSKVLDLVNKDLKAGKSNEEILTHTSIPGAEEWTGRGIQTSLNSAIEELNNK
ncbi:MBL fold metallo-hydrolase, partial [Bacteroidota bacterium]